MCNTKQMLINQALDTLSNLPPKPYTESYYQHYLVQ